MKAPRTATPGTTAAGTYARIYSVVRRIPRGKVSSYGQVAELAGLPKQARLVGYALHAAASDALPWHRVVNAEGRISLGRMDPSAGTTQRMRLENEGITFDARGRVQMELHRWVVRGASRASR